MVFVVMGVSLLRHAGRPVERDGRLAVRGGWAAFGAGLLAIAGNPKAALFYVGVLPGFFDMGRLTGADIAVIAALSGGIPFLLNLGMGAALSGLRQRIGTPAGLRRMNIASGWLLIGVGVALAAAQLAAGH